MAETKLENVVNVKDAPEEAHIEGQWGHAYKVLTPSIERSRLGVNQARLPPGCASVPFHWHRHDDEVFFVLSGRGVLRYGEALQEIGPGDCSSCPAGTKVAHQIANPFDEDLVYLAIGMDSPHEVCGYPDSGKLFVRGEGIGRLEKTGYMDGEPEHPRIFDLI